MSSMGVFAGVCVIIFAGLTSGMGLYFLSRCALRIERGHSSFFAVSQRTYPGAAIVFDSAIAIKCFGIIHLLLGSDDGRCGGVISYYNRRLDAPSGGKYFPGVKVDAVFTRQTILDNLIHVSYSLGSTDFRLVIIPLSFLRRLDSLKYTSVIALLALSYLVLTVVAHFLMGDTLEQRGEVHYFNWQGPMRFFSNLPVIIFAFTCHQNVHSATNKV